MNRFNLIWLSVLVTLISPIAQAFQVAKVISYHCEYPKDILLQRQGSGTLFSIDGRVFTLTSDHVLYHANAGNKFCHNINFKNRSYRADIFALDVRFGLALLELKDIFSAKVFSKTKLLETMQNSSLKNSIELPSVDRELRLSLGSLFLSSHKLYELPSKPQIVFTSAGYVWGVESLSQNTRTQIINFESRRHLIPLVYSMYEIDAQVEPGMSGGALFNNEVFMGVISHHYLQKYIGSPTRVKTLSSVALPNSKTENIHGLVIPGPIVKQWIIEAFAETSSMSLEPMGQFNGTEEIIIDHVSMKMSECKINSPIIFPLESVEQKIGSSSLSSQQPPQPVGGDGVGVRGQQRSTNHDHQMVCHVKFSFVTKKGYPKWPFSQETWFRRVRKKVQTGFEVTVTNILYQEQWQSIGPSIVSFLTQLHRGAMLRNLVTGSSISDLEDGTQIVIKAQLVSDIFMQLKANWDQIARSSVEAKRLRDKILLLAEKVKSQSFFQICPSQFLRLADHSSWGEIHNSSEFETHQYDLLIEIRVQLRQMKPLFTAQFVTGDCL